jgi:DNA-binding PadR family transcriptional regulator
MPEISHRALVLFGLLRRGPMTGYDVNRVVRAHGDLYADVKKANIYHLLDVLARHGHLRVTAEPGARGPRGERLVYELTPSGHTAFRQLIREVMITFEPAYAAIASATAYLAELSREEALALLQARRELVRERRRQAAANVCVFDDVLLRLAGDHLVGTIDSELRWIDRALDVVGGADWPPKLLRQGESDGDGD